MSLFRALWERGDGGRRGMPLTLLDYVNFIDLAEIEKRRERF